MNFYTEIIERNGRATTGQGQEVVWSGIVDYETRPHKNETVVKDGSTYSVLDVEHRIGKGQVASKTVVLLTLQKEYSPPF